MAIELSDLENDMQVMDYIVSNLLKQGEKSQEGVFNDETETWDSGGDCVYRGFIRDDQGTIIDTLKCAVGHIIDDDIYDDQLESQTIENQFVVDAVKTSCENWEMTDNSLGMLYVLQRIHDMIDPKNWEENFVYVRKEILDEFDGRSLVSLESARPYVQTLTRFKDDLKLGEKEMGMYPKVEL
jgi:hypothetical protein